MEKAQHFKSFKGILLSLLMAIARGSLSLTVIGGILLNLKHENLIFIFSELNTVALGVDSMQ